MNTIRQRLLSYFTAACINLAIVSGTHTPNLVSHPAIVRVRGRADGRTPFSPGELLADARVAVVLMHARPERFNPN